MDPLLQEFLLLVMPWVLLGAWTLYSFIIIAWPRTTSIVYNYYVFVSIPNVFVTMGILGTFTGIAHGLLGLDPSNMTDSLPIMVKGMKTAFLTSIYGIVSSLIFRKPVTWRVSHGDVKEPPNDEQNLLADMAASLKAIKDQTAQQHQQHLLGQKEEATRHAEMKQLLQSHFQRIVGSVEEMSDRMAKASSDAMLQALQEVIQDFNDAFKHYIGDLVEKNFDKLVESVDQLIEWQRNYREDVIRTRDAYEAMLGRFEEIVEHGERWVEVMDSIAGQGSALQQVVDEFNLVFEDSSKFRDTLDRIHAATVELKQGALQLKELGSQFSEAGQAFNRTQEHVDKWSASAEKVAGMVGDLQSTLVQLRKFDIAQIPQLEESFVKRMTQTMKSFDDLIKSYIKYLENRR